jgi:hypothetical protein
MRRDVASSAVKGSDVRLSVVGCSEAADHASGVIVQSLTMKRP